MGLIREKEIKANKHKRYYIVKTEKPSQLMDMKQRGKGDEKRSKL